MSSLRNRHLLRALAVVSALGAALLLGPAQASGGADAPAAAERCNTIDGCADVSVSGHAEPQPIRRGGYSELKITPKNDGPGTAYGIDLQVNVPSQLRIKKVTPYGARGGCKVRGTFVRCDMGDYVSQQEGVVRIKVKGMKTGTFISDAKVYSQGVIDPNGGNGQVSMTIMVQPRG